MKIQRQITYILVSMILACVAAVPSSYEGVSHPNPYGTNSYSNYGPSMAYLPSPPGKRPACAGPSDTFCTRIDYYPTELIEYLIKRYNYDFKTLLQDESMDSLTLASSPPVQSSGHVYVPGVSIIDEKLISNYTGPHANLRQSPYVGLYADDWWTRYIRPSGNRRQQSVSTSIRVARQANENSNSLCPTTSQFITPKAAVNTKGNWVYVVNLETTNKATQLIRTEKCASSQCSGLCQIPFGFTSSCTQQFVQKRLLALNGNGESLYTDIFWFPHCCVCQIKPVN